MSETVENGEAQAGDAPELSPENETQDSLQPSVVQTSNGAGDKANAEVAGGDSGIGAYDKENAHFKALWQGFHALRESREDKMKPLFAMNRNKPSDSSGVESSKQLSIFTTVNFIDPTSNIASNPVPTNLLATAKKQNESPPKIKNVYEKLTFIFERDYSSTLKNVSYKSIRSGASEIIPSLPVRPILTRSHGTAASANGDASVPWGGTAGAAAVPVTDPSEWHNGSYCHVYIAACESLEHYRTKIRPSLQAFVSQIEAAATNASTSAGSSAHYLIVFVPCVPKTASGESEAASTAVGVGGALASRLQKARQRIAKINNSNAEMSNDSVHSTDSLESQEVQIRSENGDGDPGTAAVNLLTKREQEIYKKITTDFPYGKACVLSTASLDTSDDDAISDTSLAIKTQEWSSFNRGLGTVIVNGFKDRCRRYDEELRRLDYQRMAPVPSATTSKGKRESGVGFNLSYFFLVKESLAFTYEQMQLPAEALLQYDEFRAFLPDEPSKPEKRSSRRSQKASPEEQTGLSLAQMADSGDCAGFRRRIRSEPDLGPFVDIVRRYLFARELCLLFTMDQPVELLSRCSIFLKEIYKAKMRGIDEASEELQLKQKVESAEWVVNFIWDVKCACERLFSSSWSGRDSGISDTVSVDTPGSDLYSDASLDAQSQSDKAVARELSELLEVARLFLKELGDSQLDGENPARTDERWIPPDMFTSWGPWKPRASRPSVISFQKLAWIKDDDTDAVMEGDRELFLDAAYSSAEAFEMKYLELTLAVVSLCRYSDRRRLASRLQGEVAEYFMRKGDFTHAAAVIKAIVKKCRDDQWDRCHFWRLFRLVYCQRTTAKSTDYLKTLVTCFSPRITAVAPPKALNVLQDDLEVVMDDPLVGEARYGKLAFIETGMEIVDISTDESTIGTGAEQKALLKRYCSVGEKIRIVVTITCHLPRSIFLDSLRLFVVTFADFSAILEQRESVEEEDTFRVIPLESPIEVKPGPNKYSFDWFPTTTGQYILSTIELKWKQGFFYYDSMELLGPLLGVDVHPVDATHSLTIDPGYLVPGHNQQVKITFDRGSDLVTSAKLQLICNGGLQVLPPGEDSSSAEWLDRCDVALTPGKPGEKTVLTTFVKCDIQQIALAQHADAASDESDHATPGISARAFTTYLHSQSDEADQSKAPHMKTVLETTALLLETTALTVDEIKILWHPNGESVIIRISLLCHSPNLFAVEEWQLLVPAPLKLAEGDDLNGDLLKCSLKKGDELALAFTCVNSRGETKSSEEPVLKLKLRDEVGKECLLSLPLDLDELYIKSRDSGVSSRGSLSAEIRLGSTEGNFGEPVSLAVVIKTDGLLKLVESKEKCGKLIYSVSSQGSSWLLAGKVNGILGWDESTKEVSFALVGIPTSAGIIKHFPTVDLKYESSDGRWIPLTVHVQCQPLFKSRNSLSHVAVASPSIHSKV
jgi:trafficking protein particle complex subunit 10